MKSLPRIIAGGGLLVMAASFFLPPHFYNSPFGRFLWAMKATRPFDRWSESLAFAGVAVVIAFPYLWAFIAAASLWGPRKSHPAAGLWLTIGCYWFGGLILAVLGAILLIAKDTSMPRLIPLTAVVGPLILGILLPAVRILPAPRRLPAAICLGLLPFIPVQIILARAVARDGGIAWGFSLGATGGILALVGCLFMIKNKKIRFFSEDTLTPNR